MATYHFSTPLQEEDMRKLHVGDVVYLTGHVFTARDMAHLRIRGLLEEGKPLPKDFAGAAVFHAGPVALKNEDGSWRLNVIGPTTSIRMEPYADVVGRMGRIIAGGPARSVCEIAGIQNIRTKSLGSNNKQNVVLATIEALKQLRSPEDVAKLRGKSVEEILG